MNPFAIFARSWQGLNLSPGERAFMKLVEGILFTAIGSGVLVAVQQFATGNSDYHAIAVLAGGAAAKTLFDTIKKYLAAQTDVPLGTPSLATPTPAAAPPLQAETVPIADQETKKSAVVAPTPQVQAYQTMPMLPSTPRFTTTVPQPPVQSYTPDRDWSAPVVALPSLPPQPPRG